MSLLGQLLRECAGGLVIYVPQRDRRAVSRETFPTSCANALRRTGDHDHFVVEIEANAIRVGHVLHFAECLHIVATGPTLFAERFASTQPKVHALSIQLDVQRQQLEYLVARQGTAPFAKPLQIEVGQPGLQCRATLRVMTKRFAESHDAFELMQQLCAQVLDLFHGAEVGQVHALRIEPKKALH